MKIHLFTYYLDKLKIKLPESPWKEELVRWYCESTTERIIENPLIFMNLPKKKSQILDVGCRYSLLPIQMAILGHKVYGVDIHTYKRSHPNFTFIQDNFLTHDFENHYFDAITAVSTIEHIGLSFYGEGKDQTGDIKAVAKAFRLLKHGGYLILTMPFGIPTDANWYRVYNLQRLKLLLKRYKIVQIKTFANIDNSWKEINPKSAEKIDSSKIVNSVTLVKAMKR